MTQKKAKYSGMIFNVVSEDQKYVVLENKDWSVRVLKDEVVYEQAPEDVLPSTTPDKPLTKDIPPAPLSSQLPEGKDVILQKEATSADLKAKAAKEQVELNKTELAAAQAKQKELAAQVATAKKTGVAPLVKEEEMTQQDPLITDTNQTDSGYYVTYSDEAINRMPLEKNRTRVGALFKFGAHQYKPGANRVLVTWYDNKNNPEYTSVKNLKPLDVATAKQERENQKLSEELDWNKYEQFKVDVNPETAEQAKKTNDDRLKTALSGLQLGFRKMLEEIDQVLNVEDDAIHFDPDRVSDDVNYNDLDNHCDNLDVEEDTSFENALTEEEEQQLVDNHASIMFDGEKYWYEKYEPAAEITEETQPLNQSEPCSSIREAFSQFMMKEVLAGQGVDELMASKAIDIDGQIYEVSVQGNKVELKSTDTGETKVVPILKVLQLVKSRNAHYLDTQLTECGTAAVAGPGVADGTVNQAITGEQGIAIVPSRLGAKPDKRIEESLFKAEELKLNESGYPKLDLSKLKK